MINGNKRVRKRIIADTNLWYRIHEDNLLMASLRDEDLILTHAVLCEIGSSARWGSSWETALSVTKNIHDFAKGFCAASVFHVLAGVPVSDVVFRKLHLSVLHLGYNQPAKPDEDRLAVAKAMGQEYRSGLIEPTVYINQYFKEAKDHLPNSQAAAKWKNSTERFRITKELLTSICNAALRQENQYLANISMDDIDWDSFDFFVNAFHEFWFQHQYGTYKIDVNDWVDIFNTVYVQDGDFYFTEDKKVRRICEDAGQGHRLFR